MDVDVVCSIWVAGDKKEEKQVVETSVESLTKVCQRNFNGVLSPEDGIIGHGGSVKTVNRNGSAEWLIVIMAI